MRLFGLITVACLVGCGGTPSSEGSRDGDNDSRKSEGTDVGQGAPGSPAHDGSRVGQDRGNSAAPGAASSTASPPPTATADAGSAAGNGADSPPPPPPAATPTIGTYIALGDSISDGGGEGPRFVELLVQNDDDRYPEWQNHDLSTKFPGLTVVRAAKDGAQGDVYPGQFPYGVKTLKEQVRALGNDYKGDILVTLTVGGNDLRANASASIEGRGDAALDLFEASLRETINELTAPGRLGRGRVIVYEANIYDATDGLGNWTRGGLFCPRISVNREVNERVFTAWNGVIDRVIRAHPGTVSPLDLHSVFRGHGINGTDNWFAGDCVHPNRRGHHEIRAHVWHALVGSRP